MAGRNQVTQDAWSNQVMRNRWFCSNCSLYDHLLNSLTPDYGITRLDIRVNRWSKIQAMGRYFGLKCVDNKSK